MSQDSQLFGQYRYINNNIINPKVIELVIFFIGASIVLRALFRGIISILSYLTSFVQQEDIPNLDEASIFKSSISITSTPFNNSIHQRLNEKFDLSSLDPFDSSKDTIPLFDAISLDYYGDVQVDSFESVSKKVSLAKAAQKQWSSDSKIYSFEKRKQFLRVLLKFILSHQSQIAEIASRDSGKTMLDATIGEITPTCEKLVWLIDHGEKYLQREERDVGRLMIMKRAFVEYVPLGVIGAIVPWNYPFLNVMNPLLAAIFSGNAIIIKVSEFASWSIIIFQRLIYKALEAVGLPLDLVQFVVGYGKTGDALVRSSIDKLIFVGSPTVGMMVAKAAAVSLLPVTLELGGKDPFVVCDDVSIDDNLVQTACRGVWQNMGQNCAGPERFLVYDKVFDKFVSEVQKLVGTMKQAEDCGTILMGKKQIRYYQRLVDDAIAKGATLVCGGVITDELLEQSRYPPTVLADVPLHADITSEEIFGPIMAIYRVKDNSDTYAIELANNHNGNFALSSCCFSKDAARSKRIGSQIIAGMFVSNDLEGCSYMSQSLPFGGRSKSGYGRFAGPEGLRSFCYIKSICEDRFSFMIAPLPKVLYYPSSQYNNNGCRFGQALCHMAYSLTIYGRVQGLVNVIKYSIWPAYLDSNSSSEKKVN